MVKINEKSIVGISLVNGIDSAWDKFKLDNNILDPYMLFYRDFEDLTDNKSLYDGEIQIFYLPKNIDLKLLDIFLTLIKKETYNVGLRIIKNDKEKLLYIFLDNIINKKAYYVDDEQEKEKVRKSLICEK